MVRKVKHKPAPGSGRRSAGGNTSSGAVRSSLSDSDPDLNLSVPLKLLFSEFVCPICLGVVVQAHLTPCGHLFCKQCIEECVNRKSVCPSCNEPVETDPVPNRHADRMVDLIRKAKEDASVRFFADIAAGATALTVPPGTTATAARSASDSALPAAGVDGDPAFTEFNSVLHQRLGGALNAYKEYFAVLQRRSDQRKQEIRQRYVDLLAADGGADPASMERLSTLCTERVRAVDADLAACGAALLESYQGHLGNVAPPPRFLPLTVDVVLDDLDQLTFKRVTVRRSDTLVELMDAVCARCEDRDDPLAAMDLSSISLSVRGGAGDDGGGGSEKKPRATGKQKEKESDKEKDKKKKENEKDSDAATDDDERPLDVRLPICLQCGPARNGGQLVVRGGGLRLQSHREPECFAAVFRKDQADQTVNYMACNECQLNWICEACAQCCHKGHTVTPFLQNHRPSWAACYCKKRGKTHVL